MSSAEGEQASKGGSSSSSSNKNSSDPFYPRRRSVNTATWELLERLHNGDGWPRSDAYAAKRYEELRALHGRWPDRLLTLQEAYNHRLRLAGSGNSNSKQDKVQQGQAATAAREEL